MPHEKRKEYVLKPTMKKIWSLTREEFDEVMENVGDDLTTILQNQGDLMSNIDWLWGVCAASLVFGTMTLLIVISLVF